MRKNIEQFILTLALFAALIGSFFSMLEWSLGLMGAVFNGTFNPTGVSDGFLLVFNRLFAISEQRQSFMYVMFYISSPENIWDANIAAALISIVAFFAAISIVLVHIRRKVPIIAMMLIIAVVQIHFGVFPTAVWNIALFATIALLLVSDKKNHADFRSYAYIITLLVLIMAVIWVVYPGRNLRLHEFSESIRDRFDTQINPFTIASVEVYTIGLEPEPIDMDLNVVDVQEETLHELAHEDYFVEYEERAQGAEVGLASPAPSLLPAILAVITITVIAAIIRYAPPLIKAAKRRKTFDIDDCPTAINNMFIYMLEWLDVFGLKQKNIVFSAYTNQLAELVSPQYSQEYSQLTTLWQKAMYSNHNIDATERQRMKDFLNKTTDIVWKNSGIKAKIKIKFHHFL